MLPPAQLTTRLIPLCAPDLQAPRVYTDPVNRRVYSDHCAFFVYLTDVREGDGGLCVVCVTDHTPDKSSVVRMMRISSSRILMGEAACVLMQAGLSPFQLQVPTRYVLQR